MGFYLNLSGMSVVLSPILVSTGVTLTLLAALGACVSLLRRDTPVR